jgi:hypothetical protein
LDDTFCSVAYTPRKFNKGSVLPEKASHADASTQAGESRSSSRDRPAPAKRPGRLELLQV